MANPIRSPGEVLYSVWSEMPTRQERIGEWEWETMPQDLKDRWDYLGGVIEESMALARVLGMFSPTNFALQAKYIKTMGDQFRSILRQAKGESPERVVWTNAERTVMVEAYGTTNDVMTVALRSCTGHTWGPPVTVVKDNR